MTLTLLISLIFVLIMAVVVAKFSKGCKLGKAFVVICLTALPLLGGIFFMYHFIDSSVTNSDTEVQTKQQTYIETISVPAPHRSCLVNSYDMYGKKINKE